jgi:hypothetical protein
MDTKQKEFCADVIQTLVHNYVEYDITKAFIDATSYFTMTTEEKLEVSEILLTRYANQKQ